MDAEIAALAGTAGNAIVTLMATDVWQRAQDGLATLWRRVRPDRADAVVAELQASREDLLLARRNGETQSEDELRVEWQGRLRRLLSENPSVADELRRLMDALRSPDLDASTPGHGLRMQACASEGGRVYQAGRDQHITER